MSAQLDANELKAKLINPMELYLRIVPSFIPNLLASTLDVCFSLHKTKACELTILLPNLFLCLLSTS